MKERLVRRRHVTDTGTSWGKGCTLVLVQMLSVGTRNALQCTTTRHIGCSLALCVPSTTKAMISLTLVCFAGRPCPPLQSSREQDTTFSRRRRYLHQPLLLCNFHLHGLVVDPFHAVGKRQRLVEAVQRPFAIPGVNIDDQS